MSIAVRAVVCVAIALGADFNAFGQYDFVTGMNWVSTSTVTSDQSPLYSNGTCTDIQYTLSTTSSLGFRYETNAANGTGVIFPGTSGTGNSIQITLTFNAAVADLSFHIVDLDEDNMNNGGTAEEYLYNFSTAPSSVNTPSGNAIYLTNGAVTPDDGNASHANNNTSGWVNWSGNITTLTFTYVRSGSSYEFLIDSMKFNCACPAPEIQVQHVTFCPGGEVQLTPSYPTGDYAWSTGSTASTATATTEGWYWVKSYTGECYDMDSIYVEEISVPVLDPGDDVSVCEGDSASWQVPAIFDNPVWQPGTVSAYTFSAGSTGEYYVSAYYEGCSTSDSVHLTVYSYPETDAIDSVSICSGTSYTFVPACNTCSYTWSDQSSVSQWTIDTENWYWVDMSNHGCVTRDSLYLAVLASPPDPELQDTIICEGSTALISADPTTQPVSYLWSNGSTNSYISVSQAGTYSLTSTSNGCSRSDDMELSYYPSLSSALTYDTAIVKCSGKSMLLEVSVSSSLINITWSVGVAGPKLVISDSGTYVFTASTPCETIQGAIRVTEENCYCNVYVPNAFTPDGDEFNNYFGVKYDCSIDEFRLLIFNRWGEIVFESADPDGEWDGTYHDMPVPDGIYTYKLSYKSAETGTDEQKVGHVAVLR